MTKERLLILAGFVLAFGNLNAHAAKFANQFVEFEMPPKWQCNLEGAEWVCQSSNKKRKRDAIIILAAKLRGDQDSLDQYLAYLKKAKTYKSVKGRAVKSDPKYAKTVKINAHPWVDSLHLDSEIPGFYTRYLATIKKDIGVLVTYSINKAKYQQYLGDFEALAKTLKVFRKSGGLNAKPRSANLFQNTNIPTDITQQTVFPSQGTIEGAGDDEPQQQKPPIDDMTLILIGAALFLLFVIWRKRRGQ